MARYYWVDPPSGWQYGFPRVYDMELDDIMPEWLVSNGYPEKDVYSDWFCIRQWEATEEEKRVQDNQ